MHSQSLSTFARDSPALPFTNRLRMLSVMPVSWLMRYRVFPQLRTAALSWSLALFLTAKVAPYPILSVIASMIFSVGRRRCLMPRRCVRLIETNDSNRTSACTANEMHATAASYHVRQEMDEQGDDGKQVVHRPIQFHRTRLTQCQLCGLDHWPGGQVIQLSESDNGAAISCGISKPAVREEAYHW